MPPQLENPADDPRDFQNRAQNMFDVPDDLPGTFEGFLRPRSVSPCPNNSFA